MPDPGAVAVRIHNRLRLGVRVTRLADPDGTDVLKVDVDAPGIGADDEPCAGRDVELHPAGPEADPVADPVAPVVLDDERPSGIVLLDHHLPPEATSDAGILGGAHDSHNLRGSDA